MEHYLVLADDIDATRDFYRDVLGLRAGFRPNLAFPGHWVYLGERPCIHIAERKTYSAYLRKLGMPVPDRTTGSGTIDHIAFNATDFEGMLARLERLGVRFGRDTLQDIELEQIFLHDPNGVKIELNFRNQVQGDDE
jgi:catechol 2,3-dioxygenase-like lactoylglutathione lyase family enzyme